MKISVLGVLAAALALAACSTPPVRERPPLPAAYYAPAGDAARPADPAALAYWWRQFDDPLLAELVETALVRSLDQQAALAQLRIARAQLRQSRAALLPRLDLGGQASRQIINTDALADTPLGEEFDVGGDVNFDTAAGAAGRVGSGSVRREPAAPRWGRAPGAIGRGTAGGGAPGVASNLAQGYVQARALLAQRALLDEGVRIAREAERVADGRFRLGEVTRLDVEAAGAQRAALEAQRGDIDAGLAETAFALDTLIDRPHGTVLQRRATARACRWPMPGFRADSRWICCADDPTSSPRSPGWRPPNWRRWPAAATCSPSWGSARRSGAAGSRSAICPVLRTCARSPRSSGFRGWTSAPAARRSISPTRRPTPASSSCAGRWPPHCRRSRPRPPSSPRAGAARRPWGSAVTRRTHPGDGPTHLRGGPANLADLLDAERAWLDARQQALDTERAVALAQIALYTALGGGWRAPDAAAPQEAAVRDTIESVPDRIRAPASPAGD